MAGVGPVDCRKTSAAAPATVTAATRKVVLDDFSSMGLLSLDL
ncbi:hypothetical protein [Mesobaculum littorinae]|nr:hypothetical protein [Mesobaculum littorinae]